MYYILFPKTEINRLLGKSNNYIESYSQIKGKGIEIYVREGLLEGALEEAHIIYNFDENMKLTAVTISSLFNGAVNYFVDKGKMKPISDYNKYADSLKSEIRWWDGDKFVIILQ